MLACMRWPPQRYRDSLWSGSTIRAACITRALIFTCCYLTLPHCAHLHFGSFLGHHVHFSSARVFFLPRFTPAVPFFSFPSSIP